MAALIFDLDGTLTDSQSSICRSFEFALEKSGFRDFEFDPVQITQQDLRKSLEELFDRYQMASNDSLILDFIETYRTHQEKEAEEMIKLYPEVLDSLEALRKRFRLALATTKHSAQAHRICKKLKLDSFFQHIQGTDPGMRYKPEPDILLACSRVLDVSGPSSAYVGDSLHDMHAAQAGGMKRIGAAYGFAGDQQLKDHGPDWLLYKISDLLPLQEEIYSRFKQVA